MVYIPSIASSLALLTLAASFAQAATTCTVAKDAKDDATTITAAFNACKNGGTVVFTKGQTYNLKSLVSISGLKNVNVQFYGTVNLPAYNTKFDGESSYFFIKGDNIHWDGKNLGSFVGGGQDWWNAQDKKAPSVFRITATASSFVGFKISQSPRAHLGVTSSDDVLLQDITLHSVSGNSNLPKNTQVLYTIFDALDISNSKNIVVQNSDFTVGDDCLAINGNVSNVTLSDVTCTNGHGFSVGSLGKGGETDVVKDITVQNSACINCQNGVRIKTWPGGKGSVSNVKFKNVDLSNVENAVLITTHYCDNNQMSYCNGKDDASLTISDVNISGLTGSMSGSNPIVSINCSTNTPCSDFTLSGITISKNSKTKANVCTNLKGSSSISYSLNPP
ncbi:exopolygalacturonase precursor [Mucor ambiguus]|uniref:Exopolygalacturonase n=1 Tax=Mucor ambiguus TaxID=91626 RepID=A0A0C9MUN1_9FUNG|nr:exopolygalacturonase precursor [Mucor ambiguus]